MPLSAAQIRLLKRKAADNSLEVENLLKVAVAGDASAAVLLRQLKADHDWSDTGFDRGRRIVPFGRWADVVCRFLEDGYPGLVALATGRQSAKTFMEFCLAVLCELHTVDSVQAVLAIGRGVIRKPDKDKKLAHRLVLALNEVLSMPNDLRMDLDAATEGRVREFLHRFLGLELSPFERMYGIYALREVGNADSVALIETLPPFKDRLNQRAVNRVIKAINTRSSRTGTKER
jgi:hypothetical protein